MVTDVQNWLNNPATNFGWILKNADETEPDRFPRLLVGAGRGRKLQSRPRAAIVRHVRRRSSRHRLLVRRSVRHCRTGLVHRTRLPGSPATNWSATDGGADLHAIPGGGVTNVIFGATGNSAGPLSTTLGADFSINSLTFTSARTNSVIIGGANTLTLLSGGITVQSGSGAHTIDTTGDTTAGTPGVVLGASQTWTNNSSNPLTVQSSIGDAGAGNTLTIAGTGVIQLAAANTYTGGTTVSSGTLVIGEAAALPTDKPLTISGGTVALNPNITLGSGTATSNVNLDSLSIAGNGVLDISNNHIIINYGSSDPFSAIFSYLKSGYNNGRWNGPGIISSTARLSRTAFATASAMPTAQTNKAYRLRTLLRPNRIEIHTARRRQSRRHRQRLRLLHPRRQFRPRCHQLGPGQFPLHFRRKRLRLHALAANFGQGDSGADVAVSQADIAALDSFAIANGLPLPTFAAMPEPASIGAILVAGVATLSRRRRR